MRFAKSTIYMNDALGELQEDDGGLVADGNACRHLLDCG